MYSSWPTGVELVAISASSVELKGSTERGYILFIQPYKPAPYNAYEAHSWCLQITRRILPQCDSQYTGTCRQRPSTVDLFFFPPLLSVVHAGAAFVCGVLGAELKLETRVEGPRDWRNNFLTTTLLQYSRYFYRPNFEAVSAKSRSTYRDKSWLRA
jgi:hypothetical protein